MVYRTSPFSTTLNDPYARFQGHAVLWRWIFPKRYEIDIVTHALLNNVISNDLDRVTLSNLAKYSMTRSASSLSATAELLGLLAFTHSLGLICICAHGSNSFSDTYSGVKFHKFFLPWNISWNIYEIFQKFHDVFFRLYTHLFNIFLYVKHYLSFIYAYCNSLSLSAGLLAWWYSSLQQSISVGFCY